MRAHDETRESSVSEDVLRLRIALKRLYHKALELGLQAEAQEAVEEETAAEELLLTTRTETKRTEEVPPGSSCEDPGHIDNNR